MTTKTKKPQEPSILEQLELADKQAMYGIVYAAVREARKEKRMYERYAAAEQEKADKRTNAINAIVDAFDNGKITSRDDLEMVLADNALYSCAIEKAIKLASEKVEDALFNV